MGYATTASAPSALECEARKASTRCSCPEGTTASDVLYGQKHGTPPQQVEDFKTTLNNMTKKSKS